EFFNSSGQNGFVPVTATVPIILHQVCFSVPDNTTLTITEDVTTDLTTSIDVSGNNVTENPFFAPFNVSHAPLMNPMDGSSTVQCVEDAVVPPFPNVVDQCGSAVPPVLVSIVDNPTMLTCEGTRTYTYSFTDCKGSTVDWMYTYTIDHTMIPHIDGMAPPSSMNVVGIQNAIPPVLPTVLDVCDHPLTAQLISVVDDPDPIVCEGTRVYHYRWTDCSMLSFDWFFTYVIDNIPVVTCPNDFAVCLNDAPFMLTGATPPDGFMGGTGVYSGAGVSMGVFSPTLAGVGPHLITYTFTNAEGCSNFCTFTITVKSLPSVTCRPNASVCITEAPFVITGSIPPGGTYSGDGVTGGTTFNPALAGLGPHTITYTVNGENGCTNQCSFVFNVTNCPGTPIIEIIPIDPCTMGGQYGSCNYEGSCCDNILCYAIRYTPGYSGMLSSYTTGFLTNCYGFDPIVYNQSCVMNDNSASSGCISGVELFNSSGNTGTLPITAGVPVILHRICFHVLPGQTLNITEDVITDLTCSITLTGGGQVDELPNYTPVSITRTPPFIPIADVTVSVACVDDITDIGTPAVFSQCCQPVTPVVTYVDTPDPITCAGTRVYTATYTDCGGATSVWHKTYIVTHPDFTLPPNPMPVTVSCPDQTVPPVVPPVFDYCGTLIPTPEPIVSPLPVCEGTRTYTYTFVDCNGHSHDWVFTYIVDYSGGLIPPPPGETTVSCPIESQMPPFAPPIMDACGRPVAAVPGMHDPAPACNGDVVWHFTYTACDGTTTVPWTYTYHVIYSGGLIPPPPGQTIVSCPIESQMPPFAPPILDACGRPVMAVPVSHDPAPTCNGDVQWHFTYTACDGVTTVPWTYTYHVIYSGGLIPPLPGQSIVSCPAESQMPPFPPPILDACGRPVFATFITHDPAPTCNGDVQWHFTYTACDGVTTVPWTYTYHVIYSGGLIPPLPGQSIVSC
ncbi:MAG TPA: hypothetical protein VJ508_12810, partial [Saprospiraceae bacterium]|nr:hypothetical protein [Saprospiraceae bacterium]